MDFDVFDKLSELETKVYVLEAELQEKDATIQSLLARIKELDEIIGNSITKTDLKSDLFSSEDGKSIADVLKETSESALQRTGYTFNERTGLYFDENSGYYYDPKNHLFYEPKSNTYYRYNAETREYTHQASVDKRLAAQFKHVTNQIYQSGENKQVQQDSPGERTRDRARRPGRDRRRRRHWSREGYRSTSRHRRLHHRSRSATYSPSPARRSRMRRSNGGRRIRSVSRSSADESMYRSRSLGNHRRRRRYRLSSTESEDVQDGQSDSLDESDTRAKSTSLAAEPVVYPPVVRLMLLASQHAPVGTVFIVTSEESSKGWACIGSSEAMCPTVNFPDDPTIDPIHCEIVYDEDDKHYALMDRDSESGTYLNGRILAKQAQIILHHGDVIRIGTSRLLVHIHTGCDSCGQCDPEVVRLAMEAEQVQNLPRTIDRNTGEVLESAMQEEEDDQDQSLSPISAATIREFERRVNLDQLKEKYGLKHRVPVDNATKTPYIDRAAQRRAIESNLRAAGYVSPERAKRTPLIAREIPIVPPSRSSTSVPLAAENRGAKLLSKMGWNPGQGLGKDNRGIAEPISVTRRINPFAGLGSSEDTLHGGIRVPLEATPREIEHARRLAITRERYERAT